MGDVILTTQVRSHVRGKPQRLALYFDTGSKQTFVRSDVAGQLGNISSLKTPIPFQGLGDGRFVCQAVVPLFVNLKGIWCDHLALVAEVGDIDEEILVGHDFMQKYDLRIDPKRKKVLIDKQALLRAQRIRRNFAARNF
jgi:hypothetical protein